MACQRAFCLLNQWPLPPPPPTAGAANFAFLLLSRAKRLLISAPGGGGGEGGGSSSFRGHGRCQKPPTFPSAAAHTVVGFSLSPFLEATPAATVIDAFFPFQALLLAWGSFVRAMTNSLFPATSILFKSRD